MTPRIFPLVAADPACTALLGTGPTRFWPWGLAPPTGRTLPYAVWRLITGSPENYLGERPDVDDLTLQIDIYAATDTSATQVAEALRNALELRANIVRWGEQDIDQETKNHHFSFDLDWFEPR